MKRLCTWEAGVSSKQEIDIAAMSWEPIARLGPFGGWVIGAQRVYELLHELSRTDVRYTPADALVKRGRYVAIDCLYLYILICNRTWPDLEY